MAGNLNSATLVIKWDDHQSQILIWFKNSTYEWAWFADNSGPLVSYKAYKTIGRFITCIKLPKTCISPLKKYHNRLFPTHWLSRKILCKKIVKNSFRPSCTFTLFYIAKYCEKYEGQNNWKVGKNFANVSLYQINDESRKYRKIVLLKCYSYKDQLISERNFGVFKSPQKRTKFLNDFCPSL